MLHRGPICDIRSSHAVFCGHTKGQSLCLRRCQTELWATLAYAAMSCHNGASLLQVALQFRLCKPRPLHMNLSEVLRAHLELPHAILPGPINYAKVSLLITHCHHNDHCFSTPALQQFRLNHALHVGAGHLAVMRSPRATHRTGLLDSQLVYSVDTQKHWPLTQTSMFVMQAAGELRSFMSVRQLQPGATLFDQVCCMPLLMHHHVFCMTHPFVVLKHLRSALLTEEVTCFGQPTRLIT